MYLCITVCVTGSQAAFTFSSLSYATLTSNATLLASFSSGVVASVAAAAGAPSSYVSIASITSGSVVVIVQLSLPSSSYSSTQVGGYKSLRGRG